MINWKEEGKGYVNKYLNGNDKVAMVIYRETIPTIMTKNTLVALISVLPNGTVKRNSISEYKQLFDKIAANSMAEFTMRVRMCLASIIYKSIAVKLVPFMDHPVHSKDIITFIMIYLTYKWDDIIKDVRQVLAKCA